MVFPRHHGMMNWATKACLPSCESCFGLRLSHSNRIMIGTSSTCLLVSIVDQRPRQAGAAHDMLLPFDSERRISTPVVDRRDIMLLPVPDARRIGQISCMTPSAEVSPR